MIDEWKFHDTLELEAQLTLSQDTGSTTETHFKQYVHVHT